MSQRMDYDVIVIGGGHAGVEAAWAAAKMGCSVALVTMDAAAIGRMSCNPAIGGIGKGHIVREIDALGGLMGLVADRGCIQFRILNRSKGPAVWAPRAQADRKLYAAAVQDLLRSVSGLHVIEGLVDDLMVEDHTAGLGGAPNASAGSGAESGTGPVACDPGSDGGLPRRRMTGLRLKDGRTLRCAAVIITTGTFLRGLMHCGERQTQGGRIGEPAAVGLSAALQRLGLCLARFKTGTPPRIDRDSIDYRNLAAQPGDDPPIPFSFMTDQLTQPQIECWITHTNAQVHDIIRANIHRAPMYSGQIQSRGPRYCPSIEDKVMRFADKDAHQIFLEPEGYDSPLVYANGIPTSLPPDVQEAMIAHIPGLEHARIVQYGYAVEYDWAPTDQTRATLESKQVAGLYLAGQINGTSGYEEAAGQGLLAGINAALAVRVRAPLILGRDEAYIGVMIDDLVTRPPDEPYRMFTSRAEYRLNMRSDNADQRLTPMGRRIGLVDDTRWARFEAKREAMTQLVVELASRRLDGRSLAEHLRRPEVTLAAMMSEGHLPLAGAFPQEVVEAVEIQLKYAGYLEREQRLIDRHRQIEARSIPEGFDYAHLRELRFEAREKFARFRPHSLGQAARISGISPADITVLALYLSRGS